MKEIKAPDTGSNLFDSLNGLARFVLALKRAVVEEELTDNLLG